MIHRNTKRISKGILFMGCSFTWGQGLYYYSNLSTLKEPPPNKYYANYIRPAHVEFMKKVRYPRLVSNYFNTWELVAENNGGTNLGAISHWTDWLNKQEETNIKEQTNILDWSEIDTIVFQLTQPSRDCIEFTVDTKIGPLTLSQAHGYLLDPTSFTYKDLDLKQLLNKSTRDLYMDYLLQNNLDIDQEFDKIVAKNLSDVKQWLIDVVLPKNIKIIVTTWPQCFVKHIQNDRFFDDKFVTFKYKDKTFTSIEELMSRENPELTINTDYETFLETPKDHHPSLKCHRVISENLIDFLKNNIQL